MLINDVAIPDTKKNKVNLSFEFGVIGVNVIIAVNKYIDTKNHNTAKNLFMLNNV